VPAIPWDALRGSGPVPGVAAAVTAGAQLSAALYTLDAGAVVPPHAHDSEEFGLVLRGSLELDEPAGTVTLGPGEAFLLAGGVEHSARAGAAGCELVECYAPPRVPA
jgi:quercetin dioxygenase-like cupin family protein